MALKGGKKSDQKHEKLSTRKTSQQLKSHLVAAEHACAVEKSRRTIESCTRQQSLDLELFPVSKGYVQLFPLPLKFGYFSTPVKMAAGAGSGSGSGAAGAASVASLWSEVNRCGQNGDFGRALKSVNKSECCRPIGGYSLFF